MRHLTRHAFQLITTIAFRYLFTSKTNERNCGRSFFPPVKINMKAAETGGELSIPCKCPKWALQKQNGKGPFFDPHTPSCIFIQKSAASTWLPFYFHCCPLTRGKQFNVAERLKQLHDSLTLRDRPSKGCRINFSPCLGTNLGYCAGIGEGINRVS